MNKNNLSTTMPATIEEEPDALPPAFLDLLTNVKLLWDDDRTLEKYLKKFGITKKQEYRLLEYGAIYDFGNDPDPDFPMYSSDEAFYKYFIS